MKIPLLVEKLVRSEEDGHVTMTVRDADSNLYVAEMNGTHHHQGGVMRHESEIPEADWKKVETSEEAAGASDLMKEAQEQRLEGPGLSPPSEEDQQQQLDQRQSEENQRNQGRRTENV